MQTKNHLLDIIKNKISQSGPITVEEYMQLCLYYPEYGYYMTKNSIGANGDFITSPEISQLFGEILGVFIGQILLDNDEQL
jgi:NADH dehydrogenase [ubiquinone] 1 alpha subcomplex assembly factor 7